MTCSAWPATSPTATVCPYSSRGQAPAVKITFEASRTTAAYGYGAVAKPGTVINSTEVSTWRSSQKGAGRFDSPFLSVVVVMVRS